MIQGRELRIGITMRVTDAVGYIEKRDSIAQDWALYLKKVLPNAQYLFIPNIGNEAVDYAEKWNINVFIFSGGENIGSSKSRDQTEFALFEYALTNKFPILGVCRGLQLIYTKLGGTVEAQNYEFSDIHKAKKHYIEIEGIVRQVNSYHENKLIEKPLPDCLTILAKCVDDDSIEAVRGENILGVMWHPEREYNINSWETEIIHSFLIK
jgi:putative glutamine amidotransferase